ncbi:MAG: phosphate ABC transporter permease PstA [Planctomycetes bacterium]|nr:phosphate ABC transporter permease PstA [Planctomycetota bacterium]
MKNQTVDPRRAAAAPRSGGEGAAAGASSNEAARFTATSLDQRNARTERGFHTLFLAMSIVLILPVLAILSLLITKGAPAFSWEFFTEPPRAQFTEGGIFPALVGTLWLVIVALLASVPLGVAAAIYLSEYAKDNALTRLINLAIINLAGVPSIVHALFGLGAFVLFFDFGTSILAASLTLAIMTLPVVIVSTRETLQAVPQSFRMACWSLGATRWQTIRKVVLPNSISGILTGVILEVSRTVGETAPVMFTGAVLFTPFLPQGVLDETMAMSLHLYMIATVIPDVPPEVPYGVALSLILMVLILNSASIGFRVYLRGKKKW